MPAYIYALYCPVAQCVRYIGKAENPERRFRHHLNCEDLRERHSHRANWVRSLRKLGHKPQLMTLLRVPDGAQWQMFERFLIASAHFFGLPLTNGTQGGEGLTFVFEEDRIRWRARLTEARIASWKDETYRTRISRLSRDGLLRPEIRAKMSVIRKEVRNRPELRAMQAEITKALWSDPEHKAKTSASIARSWADPEIRAKRIAAQKAAFSTPEAKELRRKRSIAMWAKRKAAKAA